MSIRMKARKSHDKFIEEAMAVHDDLDYTKTIYTTCRNKVIVGDKYGYCEIRPDSLLSGTRPSIKSAINKTEYWVNMVKEVHVELDLDYSKVEYINNYTNVIIGTKYGDVSVTPANILNGGAFNLISAVNKTDYWINMAKETHGDKYDYSKVVYTRNTNVANIICPIHGEFTQIFSNHVEGAGCPNCSKESLEGGYNPKLSEIKKEEWMLKPAKVYTIQCWNDDEEFYKIGITTTSIEMRFKNSYMPYRYRVIDVIYTNLYDAVHLERKMHEENKNTYTPKLYFKGYTECFSSL